MVLKLSKTAGYRRHVKKLRRLIKLKVKRNRNILDIWFRKLSYWYIYRMSDIMIEKLLLSFSLLTQTFTAFYLLLLHPFFIYSIPFFPFHPYHDRILISPPILTLILLKTTYLPHGRTKFVQFFRIDWKLDI